MSEVTFEDVVSFIGDVPVGDPSAMRTYARRLQAEATTIAGRASGVTSQVTGAGYQCPAATRLRAGAVSTNARLQGLASRLDGLAVAILNGAARVEADQSAWHSEFSRVQRKLEQELHL